MAISGQVGLDDGRLVEGGAAAQTRQALQNLQAVLAANGLTISDVVKVTVFLTTMDHYAAMNEEYASVFHEQPPARTTVAVHELPLGALVEVDTWAYRRQHAR